MKGTVSRWIAGLLCLLLLMNPAASYAVAQSEEATVEETAGTEWTEEAALPETLPEDTEPETEPTEAWTELPTEEPEASEPAEPEEVTGVPEPVLFSVTVPAGVLLYAAPDRAGETMINPEDRIVSVLEVLSEDWYRTEEPEYPYLWREDIPGETTELPEKEIPEEPEEQEETAEPEVETGTVEAGGLSFAVSGAGDVSLQVSALDLSAYDRLFSGGAGAQVFDIRLVAQPGMRLFAAAPQAVEPSGSVTVTVTGLPWPDGTLLDVMHLLDTVDGAFAAYSDGSIRFLELSEGEGGAYPAESAAADAFFRNLLGESYPDVVAYTLTENIPVYEGCISFTTGSFSRFIIGEDIKERQKAQDKVYDVELVGSHLFAMDDYENQTIYVTPSAEDQVVHLCMTPYNAGGLSTSQANRWSISSQTGKGFSVRGYDTSSYTCKCDCDLTIAGGMPIGSRCVVNVNFRSGMFSRMDRKVTIVVADPRKPNGQLGNKTPLEVVWDSNAEDYPLRVGITEAPFAEPTRTTDLYAQGAEQNTTDKYLWWDGSGLSASVVTVGSAEACLTREVIYDPGLRQSNDGRSVWGLVDSGGGALRPYIHDLDEDALLAAYCGEKGLKSEGHIITPYVIKAQLGTSIGWYLLYRVQARDTVTLSYHTNLPDGYVHDAFYNNPALNPVSGYSPFTTRVAEIPATEVPSLNGDETAVFLGWNKAKDGSGPAFEPGDDVTISTDTTLYAIWNISSFIHYDANGGELAPGTPEIQSYTRGEPVTLAAEPTRDGYAFEGWKVALALNGSSWESGTVYAAEETVTASGSVTLEAQWRPLTAPLTITKTGLEPGESAIYRIVGPGLGTGIRVSLANGESVTVSDLTVGGIYTVTEDSDWSWRYAGGDRATVIIPRGGESVSFGGRPVISRLKSAENFCRNVFGR